MTTTAGQVAVKLNIDKSQFEAGMNSAKKSVDLLSVALGSLASVGAGAMLLNIGKQALKASSDFEQANVQFGVMLGSAEKASKLVNELQNMANVTPFETQDLLDASKTLLNFGTNLEEILPDLQMLGDISGGNRERMRSMTLAFSQMSSAGRLMGQDLLQMINAGFNPLQVISEKTGKSMAELKDEMGEGKISVEMVKQAFKDATSEGGRFYGMMDKQSETLEGRFSTLNDAYTLMIRSISDGALPVIKQEVIEVTKLVEKTTENIAAFKEWAAVNQTTLYGLQNASIAIAGAVVGSTALAKIIPQVQTAYAAATATIEAEAAAQTALSYAQKVAAAEEVGLYQATLAYNAALATENTQLISAAKANLQEAQATQAAAVAKVEATTATAANTKASSAQLLMTGNLSRAIKVATVEVKAFTAALLSNPLTWVTVAVGAGAAAWWKYQQAVHETENAIKDLNAAQDQNVDSTTDAIRTIKELQGVKKLDYDQTKRLDEAIQYLTDKYPNYINKLKQELALKGQISQATAEQIANELTLAKVKQLTEKKQKIDKKVENSVKGYKQSQVIKSARFGFPISTEDTGRLGASKSLQRDQDMVNKELEKVKKERKAIVNELTSLNVQASSYSPSTSTASTGKKKKKKTDKQLAAEAKAAAKEALEYKLALLDVERYQTERTDAEIYKYELKKADLKIAAAKKGTSEYAQALAEKLQLERDYEKSLKDLQSSKVVDDLTYNKQEIDNKLAIIQLEYDAHKISKTQMLQTEIQFINQKKQLEMAALEEQLKLVKGNAAEEVKIKRASQKTMEDYNIEANRKALELWEHQHEAFKNVTSDISSGWGSTISDLLNGNLTFEGALSSLVDTVLNSFGNMCGTMVQNWVADHLTMETVTTAFGLKKVATDQMINASNTAVIAGNTARLQSEGLLSTIIGIMTGKSLLQVGANAAVGSSALTAATAQAGAAGTMATSSSIMAGGINMILAPTMKLAAAMATLALSSGASAANMSLIALSTGLFTLEATVASLTTLMLNVSLGVLSATSQLAAKGMANLAVANAANSAAMIPFVGWMMAPGAAMATGLSIAAGSAMVQFREKGGEVKKGQPYIVGEKRPELFIPDRNGRIEPNLNSLAGGGDGGASSTVYNTPVTISVQANDAASFASKIDELTDRIHSNLEKKIKRRQLAPLGGKA